MNPAWILHIICMSVLKLTGRQFCIIFVNVYVIIFYNDASFLSTGADPHFTTEPVGGIKWKSSSVDLFCKISNVVSPVYYWLKDGRNVTGGTVDSNFVAKLAIKEVQFTDMGNYSCVATDTRTASSWTSSAATLTVQGTIVGQAFKAGYILYSSVIFAIYFNVILFFCNLILDLDYHTKYSII